MALLLEKVERERDIPRGQLAAVVEARLWPDMISMHEAVRRNPHLVGRKAVHRIPLVFGRSHQAREGQFHRFRGVALQDEAVERVKGEKILIEQSARDSLGKHAALRSVRIDIVETPEVGRVLEVAEVRNAMRLDLIRRDGGAGAAQQRGRRHCAGGENEHAAPRERLAREAHWRPPTLAALAGSHHQTTGKALAPYSGILSGWLKRSQRAVRENG